MVRSAKERLEIMNHGYNSERFVGIHTTLPKSIYIYLLKHAEENDNNLNDSIIMLYEFYIKNEKNSEKFKSGIKTLQDMIKTEMLLIMAKKNAEKE